MFGARAKAVTAIYSPVSRDNLSIDRQSTQLLKPSQPVYGVGDRKRLSIVCPLGNPQQGTERRHQVALS